MFLGLDVSKSTLGAALLLNCGAPKARHKVFANTPEGHHLMLLWLEDQGSAQGRRLRVALLSVALFDQLDRTGSNAGHFDRPR